MTLMPLGLALLLVSPLAAQSQFTLTEIIQVHSRANVVGQRMTASPNRHFFVVYGDAVVESPTGLANFFTVLEAGGAVRLPSVAVPARVAAVADDGSSAAAGFQTASDLVQNNAILSRVDPNGVVTWSQNVDVNPGGIALDANGNVLFAGLATPGSRFGGIPADAPGPVAFLASIDGATGATRWLRTLGGTRCAGGSCAPYGAPQTSAGPIAVLPNGETWVAGFTTAGDLPVTPDALVTQPQGFGSWLARFAVDGTLRYASYLLGRGDTPIGMALDGEANIYIASRVPESTGYSTAFAKLNSSGSNLQYQTTQRWNIDRLDLGVDSQGHLLGAYGSFVTNGFWFARDGSFGGSIAFPKYLLQVVTAARDSIYGLAVAQPSEDPAAQDFFYRWQIGNAAAPAAQWVASSAGSLLIERVAPGELVSFYGTGLGPKLGAAATFDSSGRLPVSLAETEVRFDGAPVPLLYAADTQVNAIVPYGVAGQSSTTVQVCSAGVCTPSFALRVVAAHPNVFMMADNPFGMRAIAFNVDGTANSADAPARPGSILTLFLTGAGALSPSLPDGAVGAPFQAKPALPVRVSVGALDGQVLYSGTLADTVNSVVQLNLQLPEFDVPSISKQLIRVTTGISPAQADIYLWNNGK
jgi:uncharacterized protein (TIGR03437 family)